MSEESQVEAGTDVTEPLEALLGRMRHDAIDAVPRALARRRLLDASERRQVERATIAAILGSRPAALAAIAGPLQCYWPEGLGDPRGRAAIHVARSRPISCGSAERHQLPKRSSPKMPQSAAVAPLFFT